MRVMMTALVPSHLMLMVPCAWALRAAGHDVVVVGMADVVETAKTAGLSTLQIGEGGGFSAHVQRPAPRPEKPAGRTAGPWDAMAKLWRQLIDNANHEFVAFAKVWRPDVILCEMDFNGLITGGLLDIPTVTHRLGLDKLSTLVHNEATRQLREDCELLGLPDGLPAPTMIVDSCPPKLQFPELPSATHIRYVPYNGVGEVPDWEAKRGLRIAVSLGMLGAQTIPQEWTAGLIDAIGRAVAGLGEVEVILPLRGRAEFDSLPSMVRLVDPVPMNLYVDTCDLVVHHGGAGTALTACAYGVPQLLLPQQHPAPIGCAERIEQNGLGLSLPFGTTTEDPEALSVAIRALLDEPQYRQNTGEMAAEMTALPTPGDLVTIMESL
jgi:hypothetical protein